MFIQGLVMLPLSTPPPPPPPAADDAFTLYSWTKYTYDFQVNNHGSNWVSLSMEG